MDAYRDKEVVRCLCAFSCTLPNKDTITIRCGAFYEMMKFNIGSWMIALFIGGLAYVVVLENLGWQD
jgi:hypothetical protein